ncbi:MAG: DUF4842 domain-containing protein [Candidatus Cyclobacteriaceae bacterium M3_2C_046]
MKKFNNIIFSLISIALLLMTSCQQEDVQVADQVGVQFEIFSGGSPADNGRLSQDFPEVAPGMCNLELAAYAVVEINGMETYTLDLNIWGSQLKTNLLELTPGEYQVTNFMVYATNGDPLFATPTDESAFARFVNSPLPLDFTVMPYQKMENEVEVLCVEGFTPPDFGFKFWKLSLKQTMPLCIYVNYCDPETGHWVAATEGYVYPDDTEDPEQLIWQAQTQGPGEILCLRFPYDPNVAMDLQEYYVVLFAEGVKHFATINLDWVNQINNSENQYLHLNKNCDGSIEPFMRSDVFAFEDLVIEENDLDYNDFVIQTSLTGDGDMMKFMFKPLARGAGYNHAFSIVMPSEGIAAVNGEDDVWDDGIMKTIVVYSQTIEALNGKFINAECDGETYDAPEKMITIEIEEGFVYDLKKPYLPQLHVDLDDEADTEYILKLYEWTGESTCTMGTDEYPNALRIPMPNDWYWLIEKQDIRDAYLDFEPLASWDPLWYTGPIGTGLYDIHCPD